jgi:hypothetical protein
VDQNQLITTQVIEDVVNRTSSDRLLVRDLVEAMETIGFGLIIMIFAFGIIIPLPPPFPSLIALPLVVFSAQMMLGYQAPKLPKRFANLTLKRSVVAMLVQRSAPHIRKIERILQPRLSVFVSFRGQRVIGFFTLLFSCFIVLPMPLSNFIPGLGILIISFGLLGKDGLVVICGVLIGLIGMAISISAIFLGVEALKHIKDFFF